MVQVNGNQRSGMSALSRAVDISIVKASVYGMSIVGTNNTATSTGMLSYYASLVRAETA